VVLRKNATDSRLELRFKVAISSSMEAVTNSSAPRPYILAFSLSNVALA